MITFFFLYYFVNLYYLCYKSYSLLYYDVLCSILFYSLYFLSYCTYFIVLLMPIFQIIIIGVSQFGWSFAERLGGTLKGVSAPSGNDRPRPQRRPCPHTVRHTALPFQPPFRLLFEVVCPPSGYLDFGVMFTSSLGRGGWIHATEPSVLH